MMLIENKYMAKVNTKWVKAQYIMVKAQIKWYYYTQKRQDQNRLLYIHILIFCGCVPRLSCTSQSDAVWIVSLGGHEVLTLQTTEAKKA